MSYADNRAWAIERIRALKADIERLTHEEKPIMAKACLIKIEILQNLFQLDESELGVI